MGRASEGMSQRPSASLLLVEGWPLRSLLLLQIEEPGLFSVPEIENSSKFRAPAALWDTTRTHLSAEEAEALKALTFLIEVYAFLSPRNRVVGEVGTTLS